MRKTVAIAALGLAAVAGCSSTATSSGGAGSAPNPANTPNASLANAYLATGSGWVNYIQWNSTGTGSLTADTLTGTAPNEQVASQQTSITASVNGSEVTFTGLLQDNGTLANGTLTLQVLAPDGTLGTDTFTPATQGQFNAAVGQLQSQAASDNTAAIQQQRHAAQASASASASAAAVQAAQQRAHDVTTVNADGQALAKDISTYDSDVGTAKAALRTVQGEPRCSGGTSDQQTYDDALSVYDDGQTIYDDEGAMSTDLTAMQRDWSTMVSDWGGSVPSGATQAEATMKQAEAINPGAYSESAAIQSAAVAVQTSTGSCS